ncbi:hypothetical protein KM427_19195 [Nocardioides sp. LMS-CY]|uniref:Hemerythrin domain-containing protein n=1 Tax=Nocardioides soli TaxID=1036020 RepID=A0A7W4VXF8_9ACTN|nr:MULTISPECIES: hypothetical protein [Nocardioides]MBB3043288.1 hypothetical protein [Nocardioides soli]QWF21056.1 hypothetical protein KM427_19195 [Nocardioides sp. LMS-CY]
MGTTDVLRNSIQHTQGRLSDRLADAREMEAPPDRPRDGYARIDAFLSSTSKHLHAVDAVLLRPARRRVPDGGALVHDYLRSTKELEVVLAHVKAHEYGSVYEISFSWPEVWDGVDLAMTDHQRHEAVLGNQITESLDDSELDVLAQRLYAAELAAPSRPHPYTPHTGLLGNVARKVMYAADRFWDTLEGRMVPEPAPEPKKKPGLMAQYFLADPRFDEEEPTPRP